MLPPAGKWCNQVDVAVKMMKEGQMSHEAFLDEAKIMHKLSHRKLVQLMGVCTQNEPLYIITELMVNGALLDYLREASQSVHLMDLVDMAAQVCILAHVSSELLWKISLLKSENNGRTFLFAPCGCLDMSLLHRLLMQVN